MTLNDLPRSPRKSVVESSRERVNIIPPFLPSHQRSQKSVAEDSIHHQSLATTFSQSCLMLLKKWLPVCILCFCVCVCVSIHVSEYDHLHVWKSEDSLGCHALPPCLFAVPGYALKLADLCTYRHCLVSVLRLTIGTLTGITAMCNDTWVLPWALRLHTQAAACTVASILSSALFRF